MVESANARIKHWKYLDHVLPTNQIPHIGEYIKIVCAISNKFFPPLSSGQVDEDTSLASKMRYLSKQVNLLQQEVEEKRWATRRSLWKSIDSNDIASDFPVLSEEQLRDITCGVYQLKLSSCYTQEHLGGDYSYEIDVSQCETNIIKCKIQSRHTSSKRYMLWIKYEEGSIVGWYCQCKIGTRVVGVCSHICSVLWYLGNARHSNRDSYGVKNWGLYVEDASSVPEMIDASDSEESVPEE